jgi:hypothetical protein
MRHLIQSRYVTLFAAFFMAVSAITSTARAADAERLDAFLEVTGFDVALESIRLSADAAPQMLGIEANDFGSEWQRLVGDLFATDIMHDMARELLGATLEDDLLDHAAGFYASDLGKRLVTVENASHMEEDDDLKSESGQDIIAALVRLGSPRVEILKRLNAASDTEDNAVRAIQEVQVRFLMAAARAGVIELQMQEPDLREVLRSQEGEMRISIKENALANAAFTYQAFSDAEMTSYAAELEHPMMQKVYALMNAVQFEIMANRYEAVAVRLSGMQPSQDL